MQLKTITARDALHYEKCEHCHRPAVPGQVVAYTPVTSGPMTKRVFLIHVRCMRTLVDKAPADADRQAYEELKTLIHTTGEAFPE